MQMRQIERLLSRNQVRELTTLSLAEIDRKEHSGKFPKRLRLSDNPRGRCAYVASEVLAWIAEHIARRMQPR
jgi:predicted DNA-binding transcriptional regulator AlpA